MIHKTLVYNKRWWRYAALWREARQEKPVLLGSAGLLYLHAFVFTTTILTLLLFPRPARAEEWTDKQIVQAIYMAEGGSKATYLYGIRSVHYKDKAEAEHICYNTVRNQRKRHAAHSCGLTYLECLARRYCPIGADNDRGMNKYWIKNVFYYLNKC